MISQNRILCHTFHYAVSQAIKHSLCNTTHRCPPPLNELKVISLFAISLLQILLNAFKSFWVWINWSVNDQCYHDFVTFSPIVFLWIIYGKNHLANNHMDSYLPMKFVIYFQKKKNTWLTFLKMCLFYTNFIHNCKI